MLFQTFIQRHFLIAQDRLAFLFVFNNFLEISLNKCVKSYRKKLVIFLVTEYTVEKISGSDELEILYKFDSTNGNSSVIHKYLVFNFAYISIQCLIINILNVYFSDT